MPSYMRSFAPTDEAGEFDEELELASKELLHLLLESLPDRDKRENEVSAIGGDEVREGRGEDIGAIPHRAATPVDELQLLTEVGGEELG